MLDLSRTESYEITLVHLFVCLHIRLSVCVSVRQSLSFLKTGSLAFPDIVHDDGWPWYLVTDAVRFLKNKFGGPNLGWMSQIQVQSYVFCNFLKFGSLVFLEIVCNDSLQSFPTSSRDKIHEKSFWGQNLGERSQNWFPKKVFCPFFKFDSLVFL